MFHHAHSNSSDLVFSDIPISASCELVKTGIRANRAPRTDMSQEEKSETPRCGHELLSFLLFEDIGSHYVAQAGLEVEFPLLPNVEHFFRHLIKKPCKK